MAAADRDVDRLGHQALPPKIRMQLVPDLSAPPFLFEAVETDCTSNGPRVAMLDEPGTPIPGSVKPGHPSQETLALSFGWRIRPIGKSGDVRDRQDRQERGSVGEGRRAQRQALGGQQWKLPDRSHRSTGYISYKSPGHYDKFFEPFSLAFCLRASPPVNRRPVSRLVAAEFCRSGGPPVFGNSIFRSVGRHSWAKARSQATFARLGAGRRKRTRVSAHRHLRRPPCI